MVAVEEDHAFEAVVLVVAVVVVEDQHPFVVVEVVVD